MVPQVAGCHPMEASDLVHEESSYVARQLALRAQAEGKNVIWDITMSSRTSTERRIDELRSSGYRASRASSSTSRWRPASSGPMPGTGRAKTSYRAGEGQAGGSARRVIRGAGRPGVGQPEPEDVRGSQGQLDGWSLYDNSVNGGGPSFGRLRRRQEDQRYQRGHRPDHGASGRLDDAGPSRAAVSRTHLAEDQSGTPPASYLEMAARAQQDPEPYVPGSFDDVVGAYDRGELTRDEYRSLSEAVAESKRAEDQRLKEQEGSS